MSILKLKKVDFEGFRSFKRAHSVQLPDHGLVLVNGSGSGSGKTNFLYAILQGIGLSVLTHDNCKNWFSDSVSLSVELEKENSNIVISRYPKFKIKLDGVAIDGGANALNEIVQKNLGLPIDIVRKLTYRKQKSRGFIYQSDSDMKEFLGIVLDLGKFEKEIDKSHKIVTEKEPKLTVLRLQKENKQKELFEFENILEPIKPNDNDVILRINNIAKDRDTVQGKKQSILTQIEKCNNKIKETKTKIEDKYSEQKAGLYEQLEITRELYKQFSEKKAEPTPKLTQLNTLQTSCKDRLKKLQDADEILMQSQQLERNKLNKEIYEYRKGLDKVEECKQKLIKKNAELLKLNESKCPRCSRQWDEAIKDKELVQAEIEKLNIEINSNEQPLKLKIEECETRLSDIKLFVADPNIAKLNEAKEELLKQIKAEETIINEYRQNNLNEFRNDESALQKKLLSVEKQIKTDLEQELDILQLEQQKYNRELMENVNLLSSLEKEYSNAQKELDSIRFYYEQSQKEYNQKINNKATKEIELTKITEDLEQVQKDINVYSEWKTVNKNFVGSIFNEILEEIADETNNMICNVPNVRHCSLRFATEKETQTGKINKKIVPLINVGGHEEPVGTVVSGGQDSVIELATDLAIVEIIQRRTGKMPGWLFIDEAFEGMDPPSREASLQILQRYSQNKLVLVIDHSSEIKEMFNKVINIEFENQESFING
jgi:DNA repair exonuclease SbcCD ATPase subunit